MLIKKIAMGIALGAFVLVLSGCGDKNANNNGTSGNGPKGAADKRAEQEDVSQKMPVATGDVDDTVNAIISGAVSEGAEAESTDADASAAIGDSQDTNNLNNTYDENAL